ncbi:MAG: hypothetical protein ABH821_02980 [archaeon]
MALPFFESFQEMIGGTIANSFVGDLSIVVWAIILIVAAIVIFWLLKKLIVNVVLGLIAFAVTVFVFQIPVPFIPTLIVSGIFGPAGTGVMILLHFLGVF